MYIVLDDTAMAAAGQDNVLASRLIHRAHAESGWFLYAPACAVEVISFGESAVADEGAGDAGEGQEVNGLRT